MHPAEPELAAFWARPSVPSLKEMTAWRPLHRGSSGPWPNWHNCTSTGVGLTLCTHQSITVGVLLNPLCAAPLPRPCYTNSQALSALRCHFVPFSKLLRGWAYTPSSLVLLDEAYRLLQVWTFCSIILPLLMFDLDQHRHMPFLSSVIQSQMLFTDRVAPHFHFHVVW